MRAGIGTASVREIRIRAAHGRSLDVTQEPLPAAGSPGAAMFVNRLRKNLRHLRKWARREGVTCFRVYDADLPEYALAIDWYEGWVHVQEYAAPSSVDPARAAARLGEALRAIPAVLEVPAVHVTLTVRHRQKGPAQYQRVAHAEHYHTVHEAGLCFLVNLTDYLDTGIFLDHRRTRALIREQVAGRRFLNLFAYTGTATVYAAAGGARQTTTLDMSAVYLDWARRNLALNGFREGPVHRVVRADCLDWLDAHPADRYDLIFLDPPTFSNSKRMGDRTLDIQRDHVALIRAVSRLLTPGGVLYFSNNFQQFRMDRAALGHLDLEDITAATLPLDFVRNPCIHTCWRIRHRNSAA
jgi:23S rRNA (guanine2445-N2)-methyltransferase / 23S rRNA (guanine2069-N7)-methyltransferase